MGYVKHFINIPSVADDLAVRAFSHYDDETGVLPASFSWLTVGLFVPHRHQVEKAGH